MKQTILIAGWLTLLLLHAKSADADQVTGIVAVQPNAAFPTAGIQEAIDSLGPAGGVIRLAAGEYLLRQSIRLRSHVAIEGAGAETTFRKNKQAGSRLAAKAGDQDRSIRVESAEGLAVGDEIGIFDRTTVGWEHSHAIIKEIRGSELVLNRRIGRAFDPAQGASVVNYFPAISGLDAIGVAIRDLTIDGRSDENPGPAAIAARGEGKPPELGFTFAAINLVGAKDSQIERCVVKGWPADGISLQRGSGNRVTKCVVENCRGEGFHPGGGLADSEFSNSEARGNLANGLFFCARVERVTVKDNKFIGNHFNGIGDLGHSDDRDNVVEGNLCEANGRNGIALWDGGGNTVKGNICVSNSQSAPGKYSGIWLAATSASTIAANRCFDNQSTKTQKHGIEELKNCTGNTVTDNESGANVAAGFALNGQDGRRSGNRE
jgi:parallel beta-helix repeat protein